MGSGKLTDVCQVSAEFEIIDDPLADFHTALNAEAQDGAPGIFPQKLFCAFMVDVGA